MKKFAFFIPFLFLSSIIFAQNRQKITSHEIKINGLLLATSTTVDISYEYVKNTSTGFGVSVLYNIRDKAFPMSKFAVTPFFRVYFFSKKDYGANDLFVEGFAKMASVNKLHIDKEILMYDKQGNLIDTNIVKADSNKFYTALGISIGKKWVNRANWSLEIFAGMGATLNSSNGGVDGLPRIGINIGKRF